MTQRLARIHIYVGTCELPERELNDQEVGHDIIDVKIGVNENVMQLDLEKQPVYRRRMENHREARKRAELVNSSRDIVDKLGGTFTGNTSPIPKENIYKVRNMIGYRYRVVTLEHIDSQELEQPIEDAEIIDG